MKDRPETANPMREKKNPVSDMAEQIVKNYEQALRSSIKMQQEAVQCWSKWFNQSAPVEDWQRRVTRFTNLVNQYVPENEKRVEELVDLMQTNTRTGTELLKKAADAAQNPMIGEGQSKWVELWTSSMAAMRSASERFTQIGGRAMDTWMDFVEKTCEASQVHVPKTI